MRKAIHSSVGLAMVPALALLIGAVRLDGQITPPLKGITTVEEVSSIPLFKDKGKADAPPDTRIVTVTLDLDDSAAGLADIDLQLAASDKLFACSALGDATRGYCPARAGGVQGVAAVRRGGEFELDCLAGMIGKVKVDGANLAAAFIVPTSVALDSLDLHYSFLQASIPIRSAESVHLPLDRVVRPTQLKEVTNPLLGSQKVVALEMEARNDGVAPFPVHAGTFRLSHPTVQGDATAWLEADLLFDRTGLPPDAPLFSRRSDPGSAGKLSRTVVVPPGESRTIGLHFNAVGADVPVEEADMGYFWTVFAPLKTAARGNGAEGGLRTDVMETWLGLDRRWGTAHE